MNLNNDDQTFLCAFRTYGWESRPLPESIAHQTGKALKLGYTGPLADLLERLFDSYAVDVTTARCSYDYLYFPRIRQQVMDAMTNGWLLLLLQAGQVRMMQTLTNRFGSITGVVIRDEQTTTWMAPPDRYHEEWHDPQRTNLPNPDGQTVLIPAHLNQAHESATYVYTSDTVGGQTAHHEPVFCDIDDEILRERCQEHPIHARLDRSWWWIGGDTRPHKEDLKAFGARWSRKRSQWYIRHADIPDDLVRMFDNRQSVAETLVEQGVRENDYPEQYVTQPETDTSPRPDADAISISDSQVDDDDQTDQRYSVRQTVYAANSLNRDNNNLTTVPKATEGIVVRVLTEKVLMQRIQMISNGWHEGVSYLVDWHLNDEQTTVWALEEELSIRRSMSRFETGKRAIIGGGSSNNLIDEVPSPDRIRSLIIRDHGHPAATNDPESPSEEDAATAETPDTADLCTCEDVPGPRGWYPAENLNTWVACACLTENARPDKPAVSPQTLQHVDNPDEKHTLRTRKAIAPRRDDAADDVDRAILSQSTADRVASAGQAATCRQAGQVLDIPTEPVGELTGRVSGNVTCYGYAIDNGICVYLNLGGPRTSVEAIRSTMNDGGIAQLTPFSDDPSLELTASSDQVDGVRKGMYQTTMSNLSRARFFNAILLHETIVSPDYGGYGRTYLIEPLNADGYVRDKMMHHLKSFLQIAVFDRWTDYLWQAGRDAKLIRNVRSGGGLQVWKMSLRRQAWTRIVSGGLYEDIIAIPKA